MTLIEKHAQALASAGHIFTWTTQSELAWLAEQATSRKNILEIGTYMGATASVMIHDRPDTKLTCVDIFGTPGSEKVTRLHLDAQIKAGAVRVFAGDAGLIARRLYLDGEKFDMIWIDDGHTYSDVTRDIFAATVLADESAFICGHDYSGDVERAVNDCFGKEVQRGPDSIWYV